MRLLYNLLHSYGWSLILFTPVNQAGNGAAVHQAAEIFC